MGFTPEDIYGAHLLDKVKLNAPRKALHGNDHYLKDPIRSENALNEDFVSDTKLRLGRCLDTTKLSSLTNQEVDPQNVEWTEYFKSLSPISRAFLTGSINHGQRRALNMQLNPGLNASIEDAKNWTQLEGFIQPKSIRSQMFQRLFG